MRNLVLATMAIRDASAARRAGADDFIKGVYLESEELCAQAKKRHAADRHRGRQHRADGERPRSIEYNCEFLQVTKATRSPAWLVNALCQEPGHLFPDVLSVRKMSPTQLDLVSVKPADLAAAATAAAISCATASAP